jgi:hypothetical protein
LKNKITYGKNPSIIMKLDDPNRVKVKQYRYRPGVAQRVPGS